MKKILTLLALAAAFLPATAFSQTKEPPKPSAVLAFYDDETQLVITDAQGNSVVPSEGMDLPVNTVIKTLKTTAEIQLVPNGSIIKLAASTTFSVRALRDVNGSTSNDFSLLGGKIRAVAAKIAGSSLPAYNISTPTANCGVRGTDFAMLYDLATQKDWVCVQEGKVDFTNITTGTTVPVAINQFANTFDPVFQAAPVDAARLAQIFSDVDFVKLKPADVPGHQVAVQEPQAQPKPEASPAPTPAPAQEPAAAEAAAPTPAPASAASNPLVDFLRNTLAFEVGSVTIDGTTYSKAVLSPVFTAEKFKIGLYLPIIYTSDMFDHSDWYHPAGNDEWSFGTDKQGLKAQAADFAEDLALKIKFLEWGDQANDPAYLKVGNIEDMTLGHGTVVRNFANDQDFPAVRKIGVNTGAKLGPLKIEGVVDDLMQPQVLGGRMALDVVGDQIVFGIQTTADLHLADDNTMALDPNVGGLTPTLTGDPVLLVGGADLQLFQIDFGPIFRIHAFTDANALTTYNRDSSPLLGIDEGLQTSTIWHNYGTESGIYGNVALMDYRLSFQTEKGLYHNAMFEGDYYRTRDMTLMQIVAYEDTLDHTARDQIDGITNLGIFGGLGFNIFGLLTLEGSYRWPFEYRADGSIGSSDLDYLRLALTVPKGKLPFVKLSGGIAYERSGFMPTVRSSGNLFDASSVLSGNIAYGLTDGLDLVLTVSTAAVLDAQGHQVYDDSGNPRVAPMVSIDTRLSL
jgi:hypothetical protein